MQNLLLIDKNDLREIIVEIAGGMVRHSDPPQREQEKLFTANEACVFLRCSKPTLHRWKKEGVIPHIRIGANIRYRESDLKRVINQRNN